MTSTALPRPTAVAGAGAADLLVVEVVRRLALEWDLLPLGVITAVVVTCVAELAGSPPEALPELVERLARHRLAGHSAVDR